MLKYKLGSDINKTSYYQTKLLAFNEKLSIRVKISLISIKINPR